MFAVPPALALVTVTIVCQLTLRNLQEHARTCALIGRGPRPDPAALRARLLHDLATAADPESKTLRTARNRAATLTALARAAALLAPAPAATAPAPPPAPPQPEPAPEPAPTPVPEVDCRDLLLTPAEQLPAEWLPLRATLEACKDDPVKFQTEVLGRTLWSKQVEVCHAVARSPVTVVPAGRAVGKSYLLAGLVLWWLYTRPHALVIATGPDQRQIITVLFKELRRALSRRPDPANGTATGPRLALRYDRLTMGHTSPQRLTVCQGTD